MEQKMMYGASKLQIYVREDLSEEGWGEEHFLPQIFLPVQRIEMREVGRRHRSEEYGFWNLRRGLRCQRGFRLAV